MEVKLKTILNSKYWLSGLFLVLFVLLAYPKLVFYVRFDFNFLLMLIVLPLVVKQKSQEKSIRFGIIAIGLLLTYPFLKLSSIYFFAFVCALFFLYESQFGKLTSIPLFLVIIVSPVAIFLSEIIGFEIRLYLTKIAANTLSLIDKDYVSVGNIIMLGEHEFHVDPECMGLKMVILSLFVALIFISFRQKKSNTNFYVLGIVASLVIAYVLVVISNFFRIILITLFNSPPYSFAHEFIGIVCFVVYVIVPLWFVIKTLPAKKPEPTKSDKSSPISRSYYLILIVVLTALFLLFRFSSLGEKKINTINASSINININGFSKSREEHGVLKLVNENLLLYIKPASSFYSADHSPIICWKGSGYKVQHEQIVDLAGKQVYFSELKQGEEILYSTWWYDCGNDKTISQFQWRWQSLISSKNYRLINVISYDKSILYDETEKLLTRNIFEKKP